MTTDLQHEIGKREPFDSPEQEAFLNIIRTASVLVADFQKLFRRHQLSDGTYNALRILRAAAEAPGGTGTCSCTQIGRELIARVPDVTRLIDRLESLGFADRVRCEDDRRVVRVRITRKGLNILAALDDPVIELHRTQLSHMSAAELNELSALLVRARLGQQRS